MAVADLSKIELSDIKLGNKAKVLLAIVLQPQMSTCLPKDMKFEFANDADDSTTDVGYKKKSGQNVVYYNSEGTFHSSAALLEDSTEQVIKILDDVISAMRKVLKTEKLGSQQFVKSGEVQDLTFLDSEIKKNIEDVLHTCLEKKGVVDKDKESFSDKLKNAFMVFINFWKFDKRKKQQKPLKLGLDV